MMEMMEMMESCMEVVILDKKNAEAAEAARAECRVPSAEIVTARAFLLFSPFLLAATCICRDRHDITLPSLPLLIQSQSLSIRSYSHHTQKDTTFDA